MTYRITQLDTPEGLNDLLTATLWGSAGLRYKVRSVSWNRIPPTRRALFLAAHDEHNIVGAYTLVHDGWAFLRALLAVDPEHRGKGVAKALITEALRLTAGHSTYGTIEANNTRSMSVNADAGFHSVGEFLSRPFTRQRPRAQAHVRIAAPSELPEIASKIEAQDLLGFDAHFLRAEELLVTDDLSAGVLLCQHNWTLEHLGLPAPLDPIARRFLPLLGMRPDRYRFAFGHFWFGEPRQWNRLLEHALATQELQAISLIGDPRGAPWRELNEHVSFGVVGSMFGSDTLHITSTTSPPRPLHFTPLNGI